jgi:methylmalonyl-CoA mutase
VAMLCAGDADHAALAAPTVRALRAAGAEQVWLAGQVDPGSEPAWSADGQLYPGCDAVDALSRLLTALEAER